MRVWRKAHEATACVVSLMKFVRDKARSRVVFYFSAY